MRKLQVKDVLTRIKEPIELEDDVLYKRVTIKTKHQGVFLRDSQHGKDIGTKKQFFIKKGQFLLSKIDARNGAFGIVLDEVDGAIITGNFWTYEVNEEELNIELFYIMTSLPFFDELCKNSSSGSTNRQYLDEKKFLNQKITLPPIEEQNSFIKHFKKLQEKHSQTLEELQTQSELISKLRSSILSSAVRGKLVPQNRNDESTKVLLDKIKAEKEKLIKEGKTKTKKPLPPISEDEIPYELPDGWIWCRLNELADVGTGATPLKSQVNYYKNGTIPWVTSSLTGNSIISQAEIFITEKALLETNCKIYPKETLILAMYGQGKTRGQISELAIDATINQACAAIVIYGFEKYLKQYLKLFFQKYYLEIRELAAGGAQPNLNLQKVKSTAIPLPPLEEQQRIVEKVEKLMTVCNALEFKVQNSKVETKKLMQSVLKEVFSALDIPNNQPKASKAFQRSVLAAYIVDNSLEDKYFGHVKLQKMLFMCEVANNLDFDSHYKRHAMGPYDPKLLRSVDLQLKRNKWFKCEKMDGDKGRYIYSPLEKSDEYKKYLNRYLKFENIEKMFSLMKPMTTLQAEIVATLYSVYKDLKSMQQKISSQILINEARNNWHDRKKTIEIEKWERAIEWMKEKQLISYE